MNRFLICYLLLACYSTNAKAQFGTPNNLIHNMILGYPVSIDKGDFNQDGFEDAIIAFSSNVYWWPNNGNNGFSEPIQLSNPPWDTAFIGWSFNNMIVADVDEDGKKDVVCAVNYIVPNNSGNIGIVNSFGPGPPPPPPSKEQGRIFIYQGLGNGLFSEGKFIAKNFGHISTVRAGNLDSSQGLEIVASSLQSTVEYFNDTIDPYGFSDLPGKISVFSNNSFNDTLFSIETILSDSTIQGFNVELGDIENDGDLDVFFASGFNGFAGWMENLGNGSFGPKQWITGASEHQVFYFKLADLNGDSLIDFVYNKYDGNSYWQRNFGAGQFGNPIPFNNSNAGHFTTSDIDADGDIDLLGLFSVMLIFENTGDGSNFLINPIDHKNTEGLWNCTVDLNNDGINEILVAGDSDYGTLSVYQRNNNGDWNNRLVVYPKLVNIQNVIPADVDGDGDQDLVAGSKNDDKLVYFDNMGAGNFSEPIIISYSVLNLKDISVADFDNDLDLDIVAVSIADSNIQLFRNNGIGDFQDPEIIANHMNSGAKITAADFDQDGNIDLAGTFKLGYYNTYRKVYSIRNSGNGVFELPMLIADSVTWGSELLLTADLDQDNFPDLISGSNTSAIWMKSLGNGLFDTIRVITNQLLSIKDIKVADINQDQRNDLLVAAFGSTANPNYFLYFENMGGGNFNPQEAFITTQPNWKGVALESMDFDLDNDVDVVLLAYVSTSSINYRSALILNDGTAEFAAPDTFLPSNNNEYIMNFGHADLNDDAYPDLIRFLKNAVNQYPLSWLANTGGITTSIEKTTDVLAIYPNPNKGRFYIQHIHSIDKGSVMLFSLDGREINCNVSYSSNQSEISVNAEAGIYILSWNSNNRKEFRKVIIQH